MQTKIFQQLRYGLAAIGLLTGLAGCQPAVQAPPLVTEVILEPELSSLLQTATALAPLQSELARFTQVAPALSATPGSLPATAPPLPAVPGPAVTAFPGLAPQDDPRLYRSARILLFEDMSASRYIRLIQRALDQAGYFYLDVGSAQGWFKAQLLADTDWDLVIAGAEADRKFGGEFFGLLEQRVESGASLILETWDLDAAPQGQAQALLRPCGLQLQVDWWKPDEPVFFWTQPEHALFNIPNRLPMLRNARSLWMPLSGDLGDLLQIAQPQAAPTGTLVLAARSPDWRSDSSLISLCQGGRVIIQTFRSHEYHTDDMVALWQNYVHLALQQRFARTSQKLPTPAARYPAPTGLAQALRPGPTPGPDYIFPHACGGALTLRLTHAPRFSRTLFEHVAAGQFVELRLEMVNTGAEAVQIWAEDYDLSYTVAGQTRHTGIQKAATGFLYINLMEQLWQNAITPGQTYHTALAFDAPSEAQNWTLTLTPGAAFNQPVCQVSIPLDR